MGIQFFHYDALSRVESTSKLKNGKSIYSVAGEADRLDGYHDHIEHPQKPVILYGVPFSEVVKMAEDYAEKTLDSVGRAVRKNGFVMIAGVISAPPDMSPKVWEEFKQECLKWLKIVWGTNLRSITEHLDENFEPDPENGIKPNTLHQHLHFACVAENGVKFADIHPGLKAKREADFAYGKTKKPKEMSDEEFQEYKKNGRIAGDSAYKKAMSMEQDAFFNGIADKFGLLRFGPKGIRLTREEIIKRDHEKRLKQKNILEMATQERKALEIAADIQKAETDLKKSQAEANSIIDKAKNEANIITEVAINNVTQIKIEADNKLQIAKNNADMITRQAEAKAKGIKEKAWIKARDITNAAEKQAIKIINRAEKFINILLNKVSGLSGGEKVVNWARAFIESINRPTSIPDTAIIQGKKDGKGRKNK